MAMGSHTIMTNVEHSSTTSTSAIGIVLSCAIVLIVTASCQTPTRKNAPTSDPPDMTEAMVEEQAEPPTRESLRAPIAFYRPSPWVYVVRHEPGPSQPSVSGSFDPQRNRLTIDAKNVREFAINTELVDINWDRLVVLRLNGSNSELRQRDWSILHFVMDDHGNWVVRER
jgi:hypothetical protein